MKRYLSTQQATTPIIMIMYHDVNAHDSKDAAAAAGGFPYSLSVHV